MFRKIPFFALFALLLSPCFSYSQTNMNAPRLFELGMDALTGVGPARDNLGAIDYFRRSADLGYPPAQVTLGYFYETGNIVAQDQGLAVDWYKKAAKQGDPVGSWLLGRLYYTGVGTQKDLNAAATALQKAADQDDPFGKYLLGMVLLERNQYPQAAQWFRRAALQGLPQAQEQLGLMFKNGRGITSDKFEAYVWLLISYDAGNTGVAADLQQLQADLGSTAVEQAKSRARSLEQTTTRVVVARGCTGWQGEFNATPSTPPPDIQRFCR